MVLPGYPGGRVGRCQGPLVDEQVVLRLQPSLLVFLLLAKNWVISDRSVPSGVLLPLA